MRRLLIWVIVLIVLGFLCGFLPAGLPTIPGLLGNKLVLPAITVAPETVFSIGGFGVTNTLIATILADIIVILLFFFGTRNLKLIPTGLQNLLEAFLEALYSLTEQVAGAKARRIFPLAATIFFLVLAANWMELIPGVDSVGKIETPHDPAIQGYEIETSGFIAYPINVPVERPEGEAGGEAHPAEGASIKEECHSLGCVVVPYVRTASTDLNFTMALGLISVAMTWYYGIRTLGAGEYLSRFFNTRGFKNSLIFGSLDFLVGILELIGEFTRIISFTFRLFGNIFAGTIMILVFSSLIPALVPAGVYLLEVFVGAIQAFVFMMLTVVFIHLATIGHGGEGHGEAHAEAHS